MIAGGLAGERARRALGGAVLRRGEEEAGFGLAAPERAGEIGADFVVNIILLIGRTVKRRVRESRDFCRTLRALSRRKEKIPRKGKGKGVVFPKDKRAPALCRGLDTLFYVRKYN